MQYKHIMVLNLRKPINMEFYIQWWKGLYVGLVIGVCLVLIDAVIAGLDPCSSDKLLCDNGAQTTKYRTCEWRYTVKNKYFAPANCVNCSTEGIGKPRNLTYNISELQPGQCFQISWGYLDSESTDGTNLKGFVIQMFLVSPSECIRTNSELFLLVDLSQFDRTCTGIVDGFPADFYLNCFYNGTPNAIIKTVVSSYPQTNDSFSEYILPSPHEHTARRVEELTTPTILPIPSVVTTTTIAVVSVVGVFVFSIVIGTFIFFVNKGLVCSRNTSSTGEQEVNNSKGEAELDVEIEYLERQVEKTKKEKSLTGKMLKKQKLILEVKNNIREIEIIRSETNETVERCNDVDHREPLTSKIVSDGTHSSRRFQEEDAGNDLSTPISHVSSSERTLSQDVIPLDDLYDEYNRQFIAINMD